MSTASPTFKRGTDLNYLAELNEACAYAYECAPNIPTLQEPWSVLTAIAFVAVVAMALTGGEKA
jgi:hypothetical protein